MDHEMTFTLTGGPCDGERVKLPTMWDGRGHRPPETARAIPREPLPPVTWKPEPLDLTAKVTAVTYYRYIFDKGSHRWYEFHPEPQDT